MHKLKIILLIVFAVPLLFAAVTVGLLLFPWIN